MENFDGENIDELLEIRQICQYFPPSKFYTIRQLLFSKLLSLLRMQLGELRTYVT